MIRRRFEEDRCRQVEHYLGILSNPLRFHILCALTFRSFTVGELVDLCDGNLSNISQQLKLMWLGGLIRKERKGRNVYYSLGDKRVETLLQTLEDLFPPQEGACPDLDS